MRSNSFLSADIRYLYGKICCDLEQYERAESILTNSSVFAKPYCLEDLENFYKPDTISFALQLLGVIHQKSQRLVDYISCHRLKSVGTLYREILW